MNVINVLFVLRLHIFFLRGSADLCTKAQNYYYLLKTTHLLRNRINMCEF